MRLSLQRKEFSAIKDIVELGWFYLEKEIDWLSQQIGIYFMIYCTYLFTIIIIKTD